MIFFTVILTIIKCKIQVLLWQYFNAWRINDNIHNFLKKKWHDSPHYLHHQRTRLEKIIWNNMDAYGLIWYLAKSNTKHENMNIKMIESGTLIALVLLMMTVFLLINPWRSCYLLEI